MRDRTRSFGGCSSNVPLLTLRTKDEFNTGSLNNHRRDRVIDELLVALVEDGAGRFTTRVSLLSQPRLHVIRYGTITNAFLILSGIVYGSKIGIWI
jgi:hypothetical protein